MLTVSEKGLGFIKAFEGARKDARGHFLYNDAAGYATLGYGHLVAKRPVLPSEKEVRVGEEYALEMLREDAEEAVEAVNLAVRAPLNQAQFDALVSWFFNLGATPSTFGSTLVNLLNTPLFWSALDKNRMWPAAAIREEFGQWVRAKGVVLPGLIARRKAEATLFLEGRYL